MLCLVFESLSPRSGAATVAYLLPRPPTLCAVEGVTLNIHYQQGIREIRSVLSDSKWVPKQ